MPSQSSLYPIAPGPVTPVPDPMTFGRQTHDVLANALPGLDNLTAGASSNVDNLLRGMPSYGPTQRAGAFAGVRSGMPGSDFIRNRNFDLYQEKADSYRQRGFDDFLQLLKGASGTIAPTPGEQAQNQQFGQNLNQHQTENNQQVQQWNETFNRTARPPRLADSYTEYNTLGMRPLFGRGSGRMF